MTSCRLAVRIFDVTVLSRELKAILTRLYFPRAILTVYRGAGWRAISIYLLRSLIVETRRCTESRNNIARNYLRFHRRRFSICFHLATKLRFPHRYDTIRYRESAIKLIVSEKLRYEACSVWYKQSLLRRNGTPSTTTRHWRLKFTLAFDRLLV